MQSGAAFWRYLHLWIYSIYSIYIYCMLAYSSNCCKDSRLWRSCFSKKQQIAWFFFSDSNSIKRKNNKGELIRVIWELNLVRQWRRKRLQSGSCVVVDYNPPCLSELLHRLLFLKPATAAGDASISSTKHGWKIKCWTVKSRPVMLMFSVVFILNSVLTLQLSTVCQTYTEKMKTTWCVSPQTFEKVTPKRTLKLWNSNVCAYVYMQKGTLTRSSELGGCN